MQTALTSKPLSPREINQRIYDYHKALASLIKIPSDLLGRQIPEMTLLPNGKLETHYTDKYHILKKQIDESLQFLQKEILRTQLSDFPQNL